MQLENFIQFIIRHNAELIQGLVGLIVLCVVFLAYRSFLAAKAEELEPTANAPSLGQLEETLKKLLERANQVPTVGSAAAAAMGAGDSAPLLAEIAELKQSLESKQIEIETMRATAPAEGAAPGAAPAAGAGVSGEDRAALDAQIKELQAKLAEYEIISEDIADLSFYKEENAKLQKQLEGLKGAAPEAAAPAPAPPVPEPAAPAPEPAPAVAAPPPPAPQPPAAPVAEVTASAPDLSELTPTPAPAPAAKAAPVELADADIMKEFEMAVEEQASAAPVAAPAAAPATPAATAAPKAEAATAEPAVDLGTMDMDKMLAEATGLEAAPVQDAANALEAMPDADKLMAEAESMGTVKPDDVKLMGDFENFVKKGG